MRKIMLALCAAGAAVSAVPAAAQPYGGRDGAYSYPPYSQYDRNHRRYREQRLSRNDHVWRGNDGRYYCRRGDGTTGLIVGGATGALLGSAIAGGGDRTLGAIIGGVGGAVLGQSVDRGNVRCR